MEYKIDSKKVSDSFDVIDGLEKLLTERISELHQVKGAMQERHVFVFYRKLLWEAKHIISKNLEEIK